MSTRSWSTASRHPRTERARGPDFPAAPDALPDDASGALAGLSKTFGVIRSKREISLLEAMHGLQAELKLPVRAFCCICSKLDSERRKVGRVGADEEHELEARVVALSTGHCEVDSPSESEVSSQAEVSVSVLAAVVGSGVASCATIEAAAHLYHSRHERFSKRWPSLRKPDTLEQARHSEGSSPSNADSWPSSSDSSAVWGMTARSCEPSG
jgi:hypothetical protein